MTAFVPAFVEIRKRSLAAKGKTIRKRRARRQLVPKGIERQFRSELLLMVREIADLFRERLFPELDRIVAAGRLRDDSARADVEDVGFIIESIVGPLKSKISATNLNRGEMLADRFFNATSKRQRTQLLKQLRGVLGVDAFPPEEQLGSMLTSFRKENRNLINNLTNSQIDDISNIVQREVRAGTRPSAIEALILKRFKVSEKKAALIARDQVNKINGQLNRMRQTNLGIDQYIWRTSRDERVREKHLQREGQIFSWNEPPDGGHPGQEVNCRCTAEPFIPELTETESPAERRKVIGDIKEQREELRGSLTGQQSRRLIAR